jgi:hypothetical protein
MSPPANPGGLAYQSVVEIGTAVSFLTSPTLGSFSRDLPSLRGLPGSYAHFVAPFGVFHLAVPTFYF